MRLIAPTVHGNLLVGPTAIDTEDREGTNTTQEGIDELIIKSNRSVRGLPLSSYYSFDLSNSTISLIV